MNLKFDTMTREQLEAELNRCNEQMIADGQKIGELREAEFILRQGFIKFCNQAENDLQEQARKFHAYASTTCTAEYVLAWNKRNQ